MERLIKKIKLNYTIELVTGLHIGGNSENVEIGGIDNPVIKVATKDNQPYIPGSSLRGKMRCLLEQIEGATAVGRSGKVNSLFGYSEAKIPSRLIVRDAYIQKESAELLKNCDSLDMPYTEGKWENSIDRTKGTATNPRQTERVPAGVKFDAEFIINIWEDDDEKQLRLLLENGIKALENDYLGGNGTRGYGQVRMTPAGEPQDITFDC